MTLTLWLLLSLAMAWLGTGALRRYALQRSLMDIPNDRSSHSVPTPRGGGVAIVLACLMVWTGLFATGSVGFAFWCGILGAGLMIAITGFVDDHGHVSAGWRLVLHFFAVSWGVYWIGVGLQPSLLGWSVSSPWIVWPLVVLTLVWLLNLYNFMDGIDGIASLEAVSVCLGIALLSLITPLGAGEALASLTSVTLTLAAACLGFALWNFPRARIFMGDAGSGFIGLSLGVLILAYAVQNWTWFWCWMILLGVFFCDATVTLVRRLLQGFRVYEAHRTHAYQVASRRFGSHVPVTLSVVVINLLWLLPWAWAVAAGSIPGEWALLLSWSVLIALALRFDAGRPETKRAEQTTHALE